MSPKRCFRGIAALTFAALLLLSGCATQMVGSDVQFDGRSKDALVMMGGQVDTFAGWEITSTWWRMDPATGTFDDKAEPKTVGWESMDISDRREIRFFVFRVPAGQYALDNFCIVGGYVGKTTRYRPETIGFRAGAGEIVYIGDYFVTIPHSGIFPSVDGTGFSYSGNDLPAAQKALAAYPGVKGTVRFVEPSPVRLK